MSTSATPAPAKGLPVLWQLQISHYNEKVRWALDLKRIPHVRRSLLPGVHAIQARRLTGADTTPVLTLDGHSIGDSTAIIAELESRWPDPPLYPADPVPRARALELEAELQPSGYLVGDSFSIADLTAASLLYPVVSPANFPYPLIAEVPAEARDLLDSLAGHPGGRWVATMYERHRR